MPIIHARIVLDLHGSADLEFIKNPARPGEKLIVAIMPRQRHRAHGEHAPLKPLQIKGLVIVEPRLFDLVVAE